MKKLKYLLLTILLIPMSISAAGSASISGPSSVTNGSNATVSVTVKNTAAWNLKLSGSGATSGCSNRVADVTSNGKNTSKTFSVTCRANALGTITFTVTGDITSEDGANSKVSLTKTVTVVAPRAKETESRLKSLSVDGYDISFSSDKTSYSITIEPTVTSINIKATAMGSHASISGTGKKSIDSDENVFTITCKAENGTTKSYTINVSVKDDDPVIATIDGVEYTVYKNNKSLTAPTNSVESTVKIREYDIPSYVNETTGVTVIGIKDSDGNVKYATYEEGKYTLYNEIKSESLLLYIYDTDTRSIKKYTKTNVTINEETYKGYKIDDRYSIVYAMNISTGASGFYKYDSVEKTFQYYDVEQKIDETPKIDEVTKEENKINIFLISTILLGILLVIVTICLIIARKQKSLANKIENKELP